MRAGFWILVAMLGVLCIAGLFLTFSRVGFLNDVQSTSMENSIKPGARLIYERGNAIRRGDLVLARAPADPGADVIRRVVALPGDRVACCDANGEVTVNGEALRETYVYPGDAPSELKFSLRLGPGRVWLMGDHRSIALDSRITGPALLSNIVGRVTIILGKGSFTAVHTPATYIADGLAPSDLRPALLAAWLIVSAAALAAVFLLLVGGLVAVLRRRRGAGRIAAKR